MSLNTSLDKYIQRDTGPSAQSQRADSQPRTTPQKRNGSASTKLDDINRSLLDSDSDIDSSDISLSDDDDESVRVAKSTGTGTTGSEIDEPFNDDDDDFQLDGDDDHDTSLYSRATGATATQPAAPRQSPMAAAAAVSARSSPAQSRTQQARSQMDNYSSTSDMGSRSSRIRSAAAQSAEESTPPRSRAPSTPSTSSSKKKRLRKKKSSPSSVGSSSANRGSTASALKRNEQHSVPFDSDSSDDGISEIEKPNIELSRTQQAVQSQRRLEPSLPSQAVPVSAPAAYSGAIDAQYQSQALVNDVVIRSRQSIEDLRAETSFDLERQASDLNQLSNSIKKLSDRVNTSPWSNKVLQDEDIDTPRESDIVVESDASSITAVSGIPKQVLSQSTRSGTGRSAGGQSSLLNHTKEELEDKVWKLQLQVQRLEDQCRTLDNQKQAAEIRERGLAASYANEVECRAQIDEQFSNSQLRIKELERDLHNFKQHNADLEEQVKRVQEEKAQLLASKGEDGKRVFELEKALKRQKLNNSEIREAKEKYEGLVKDMQKNEQTLIDRLEQAQALQLEREMLRKQLDDAVEQLAKTKASETELLVLLDQEKRSFAVQREENVTLKASLQHRENECQELRDKVALLQQTNKALDQLAQDKVRLETQVREYSNKEADLLQQLKDSQRKITRLTELNEHKRTFIESEYEKKLQLQQKMIEELEETCKQFKNKHYLANERQMQLSQEKKLMQEELVELGTRWAQAKQENSRLIEENTALTQQVNNQAQEFATFNEDFNQIKQKYSASVNRYDKLLSAAKEMKTLNKEQEEKIYRYASSIQRLKSENRLLQSQLQLLKEEEIPTPDMIDVKRMLREQQRASSAGRRRTTDEACTFDHFDDTIDDNEDNSLNTSARDEKPPLKVINAKPQLDADLSPLRTQPRLERKSSEQQARPSSRKKQRGDGKDKSQGFALEDIDELEQRQIRQQKASSRTVPSTAAASHQQPSRHTSERAEKADTGRRKDRYIDGLAGYGEDEVVIDDNDVDHISDSGLQQSEDNDIVDRLLQDELAQYNGELSDREREYLRTKIAKYRKKLELKNIENSGLRELIFSYISKVRKAKAVAKAKAKTKAKENLKEVAAAARSRKSASE